MLLYAFLARYPAKHDALPQIEGLGHALPCGGCGVSVNFDAEDSRSSGCAPTGLSAPTQTGISLRDRA